MPKSRFVQIKDGEVINLWDSLGSQESLGVDSNGNGWKRAIEPKQEINPNKQYYGQMVYDISVDPVIIQREVFDYTVQERKNILLDRNQKQITDYIELSGKNIAAFSAEEIQQNKLLAKENYDAIQLCETHEELDSLNFKTIKYF
jgi:hypothetical protein